MFVSLLAGKAAFRWLQATQCEAFDGCAIQVPARKLDISELRDYCQIPTVNDLAGVLLHFAHSGNYLAGDGR